MSRAAENAITTKYAVGGTTNPNELILVILEILDF